jgi:hypothetical protein
MAHRRKGRYLPPQEDVQVQRAVLTAFLQVILREGLDALLRWTGKGGPF